MKKYQHNFKTVLLTTTCFPYIYYKSKKTGKKFEKYINHFLRRGVNLNVGLAINSFGYHKHDLEQLNLPASFLDPKQVNEEFLKTDLGEISYLKIKNRKSKKWVIGLHGWAENKFIGLRLVEHYYQAGYNILTFDAYAHGKSYGRKTDLGYGSVKMMDQLIEHLLNDEDVESLGLIGNSMGASTAINYSQIGKYKDKINWIIADSGFSNLKEIGRIYLENIYQEKWYWIGFNVQSTYAKHTKGNHNHYNLLAKMQKNIDTPIFFTHSIIDEITPYQMSEEMYRKKIQYEPIQKSELWLVDNAKHFQIISQNYDQYVQKTLTFAKNNE